MTRRNLILVGGIFHDFQASAEALSTALEPLGIESRIEPDLDAGVASLAQQPVDLVTLNALRWPMMGENTTPIATLRPTPLPLLLAPHCEGIWRWGVHC